MRTFRDAWIKLSLVRDQFLLDGGDWWVGWWICLWVMMAIDSSSVERKSSSWSSSWPCWWTCQQAAAATAAHRRAQLWRRRHRLTLSSICGQGRRAHAHSKFVHRSAQRLIRSIDLAGDADNYWRYRRTQWLLLDAASHCCHHSLHTDTADRMFASRWAVWSVQ